MEVKCQSSSHLLLLCLCFQLVTRTKKIFVGGLSVNTTIEDVKHYFDQFGKVNKPPSTRVSLSAVFSCELVSELHSAGRLSSPLRLRRRERSGDAGSVAISRSHGFHILAAFIETLSSKQHQQCLCGLASLLVVFSINLS